MRRGMTLIEVMVAIGVLAIISVLTGMTISGTLKAREALSYNDDMQQSARVALNKISRELQLAYLSFNRSTPNTYRTVFVAKDTDPVDSLWFATLAHHRLYRNSRECDQAEVTIWAEDDPNFPGHHVLMHRESPRIALDPHLLCGLGHLGLDLALDLGLGPVDSLHIGAELAAQFATDHSADDASDHATLDAAFHAALDAGRFLLVGFGGLFWELLDLLLHLLFFLFLLLFLFFLLLFFFLFLGGGGGRRRRRRRRWSGVVEEGHFDRRVVVDFLDGLATGQEQGGARPREHQQRHEPSPRLSAAVGLTGSTYGLKHACSSPRECGL